MGEYIGAVHQRHQQMVPGENHILKIDKLFLQCKMAWGWQKD